MFTGTYDAWNALFEGRNTNLATASVKATFVANSGALNYDENSGDQSIHVIFEVDGKFYKKTGYHSSYGGTEWDGAVTEVQPKTKTITVYE